MSEVEVEAARPDDAEAIAGLLEQNREVETLLLQPAGRIRARIDEFVVVRGSPELRACAQLRRHQDAIVEIMSVAVAPAAQGQGLGRACVRACVERGRAQGAELIWLATTSPGFFAKLGFERISMWRIPLAILLGKLGAVVRQPARRWPAALLGGQTFMRWPV